MPQPDADVASHLPSWLDDLLQGEHMLLWAFRATAFGAGDCRLVRRQLKKDRCCWKLATARGASGLSSHASTGIFWRILNSGLSTDQPIGRLAPILIVS